MADFRQRLLSHWYQPRSAGAGWFSGGAFGLGLTVLLLPAALLFRSLAALRRTLFRVGVLRTERLPVPVVVVGNIIAGGAGKTPLTLWLVQALAARGRRPGIVSRGYGGAGQTVEVKADADPRQVGDEPVLLANRAGVPVFVGRDRAAAGRALLAAHPGVDVLVCDDGLQHYRLARDVELAVVDARGLGNGWPLPLGPLREPASRLRTVDALVGHAGAEAIWQPLAGTVPAYPMRLAPGPFVALHDPAQRLAARALAERAAASGCSLHAIAGIGAPERFFATLAALGFVGIDTRPFADHHAYTADDLAFAQHGILLMTEKDAVKCRPLYSGEAWVLPVDAELPATLVALVDNLLEKFHGRPAA